jgi:hypothetical protein
LRQWGPPFNRMFSATCAQWHIPNNVQQSPESMGFDCCKSCKQLCMTSISWCRELPQPPTHRGLFVHYLPPIIHYPSCLLLVRRHE